MVHRYGIQHNHTVINTDVCNWQQVCTTYWLPQPSCSRLFAWGWEWWEAVNISKGKHVCMFAASAYHTHHIWGICGVNEYRHSLCTGIRLCVVLMQLHVLCYHSSVHCWVSGCLDVVVVVASHFKSMALFDDKFLRSLREVCQSPLQLVHYRADRWRWTSLSALTFCLCCTLLMLTF